MTQRYTLEQFDPREVMWVFERYNDYYFTFSHLQEAGERWISNYPVKWWLRLGGSLAAMRRKYDIDGCPMTFQQILDSPSPITDEAVNRIFVSGTDGDFRYGARIWAEEWEIKDVYNTGL